MKDRRQACPSRRGADHRPRTETFPSFCNSPSFCAAASQLKTHRTPNTCAHTANVARNRLSEARASASSTTDRTMFCPLFMTPPMGTKREHSSLIVRESIQAKVALSLNCIMAGKPTLGTHPYKARHGIFVGTASGLIGRQRKASATVTTCRTLLSVLSRQGQRNTPCPL